MNIFIFDLNQKENAKHHCNKHVVKMLLEYTQLLCGAYYFTGEENKSPYKLAHKNHPCSVWARESVDNWIWLRDLALEVYEEYMYRYGKNHKSGDICLSLDIPNLQSIGMTEFVQVMPNEYKCRDITLAYRNYFKNEKKNLFDWKNRDIPSWI